MKAKKKRKLYNTYLRAEKLKQANRKPKKKIIEDADMYQEW